MTVYEGFTCPRCKANTVSLQNTNILMSDVIINNVGCNKCGCQWRMYVKASEVNMEVTALPDYVPPVEEPVEVDENPAEVVIAPEE